MRSGADVQMTVEVLDASVRSIRVGGRFDRVAAASVLRLIDSQLVLLVARRCENTVLIIDVDGVSSSFEPGAVEGMRPIRHDAAARGVQLYLTGCSGRFHLLPLRVNQVLREFDRFPTVECALSAQTATDRAPTAQDTAVEDESDSSGGLAAGSRRRAGRCGNRPAGPARGPRSTGWAGLGMSDVWGRD